MTRPSSTCRICIHVHITSPFAMPSRGASFHNTHVQPADALAKDRLKRAGCVQVHLKNSAINQSIWYWQWAVGTFINHCCVHCPCPCACPSTGCFQVVSKKHMEYIKLGHLIANKMQKIEMYTRRRRSLSRFIDVYFCGYYSPRAHRCSLPFHFRRYEKHRALFDGICCPLSCDHWSLHRSGSLTSHVSQIISAKQHGKHIL